MLIDKIQTDLKAAQLVKDQTKTETLRLLISAIRYAEIEKGQELSDQEVISVISREVKKRREAAEGFRQGGREESAQKEEAEAQILISYLPAQLDDEELDKIISQVISETRASSISDMGRVIGQVMTKTAGQAEGGRISLKVKELLLQK